MRQQYTFQILAPGSAQIRRLFKLRQANRELHGEYLKQLQQLRGRIYVADGAISEATLCAEGRFRMPGDEDAWHLLLVDAASQVIGCARYVVHPSTASYQELRASRSCVALDPNWAAKVRWAIESDLETVRREGLSYVEVGGWAIAEEWRGTRAALEIAIGSFALGRLWGGAIGSCTATFRHGSASILRRLGGHNLHHAGEPIPAYYDPSYDCSMELLRFDYRTAAERYEPLVEHLVDRFRETAVIANSESEEAAHFAFIRDLLCLHRACSRSEIASRAYVSNSNSIEAPQTTLRDRPRRQTAIL
jgi:hypothetical protein